ncbi:MAG: GlsB/YeaQ/YmgE family stress response membrane protein [Planctomycetota bacterium]
MGLLSWMLFGALAGWVANGLMGDREPKGCFYNMFLGIIGAILGGLLLEVIGGREVHFSWSLRSFGVAVLGAVLLLAIAGSRRKRSKS